MVLNVHCMWCTYIAERCTIIFKCVETDASNTYHFLKRQSSSPPKQWCVVVSIWFLHTIVYGLEIYFHFSLPKIMKCIYDVKSSMWRGGEHFFVLLCPPTQTACRQFVAITILFLHISPLVVIYHIFFVTTGNAGLSSKLTGLHLRESKETKQKIRNLVDRLMEIVQEDNHLVIMYTVKAIFLCVSNAVALIVLVWWLYGRHWHASFPCDLSNHIPLIYKELTCSLPAAPFLYGLMICNIIFSFCICLCNIFALKWVATFRISTYTDYKNAFQKWTLLSHKLGFLDLCFCLDLTSCTTKDGKILGDIIYSSLKLYQKSDKHKSHVDLMQDVNKKAKFSSKFSQGEAIASELGLKILEGNIADDCLFNAIAKVTEAEAAKVCDAIVEELTTNMYVYKDLVDQDLNCPFFEECIELIQEKRKTPKEFHHYAIMAACNAFKVNILVLAVSSKCWYYMASENNGTLASVPTRYLFFIHPSYYTAMVDMPNHEDKHGSRQVFISDTAYRKQLQSEAKKSWEENGIHKYQKAMKALNPQVIPYGKSSVPPPKRPTNILNDLFNETGQKISIQILGKIYIPGLTKKQL